MRAFSEKSQSRLDTVHQDLQVVFNEVIKHFDCTIIYGLRTLEEQQSLYAKGRTAAGGIVTNCDGIRNVSRHQSGRAVDVIPWPIDWDNHDRIITFGWYVKGITTMLRRYDAIEHNITWGGDWTKFVDLPHYQL